jgi:hypothetical protein
VTETLLAAHTINELLPALQALSTAASGSPTALDAMAPWVDRARVAELVHRANVDVALRTRRRPRGMATPTPTARRRAAPATTPRGAPPPVPTTPSLSVSLWQRLQSTLATPTAATAANAAAEIVSPASPAVGASPEAAGPGQLARHVGSTSAFREFATPTPSKRRRLERAAQSPSRELITLALPPEPALSS